MAANEKFKKLVTLLHKKTLANSMDWTLIESSGSPLTVVADRSIVLSKTEGSYEDTVITLFIYGSQQELIEQFNDEDLGDLHPYSDQPPFVVMEELFDVATHKAKGVDDNLDAILDELDSDDVPF